MSTYTNKQKVKQSIEIMDKICTDWEEAFLTSIKGQMEMHPGEMTLTRDQQEALDAIWVKACASDY